MNRTLLWVGPSLLAAGIAAGLMPLSSQGVSCGVAFHGSGEAARAAFAGIAHDCDGVRSLVRAFAVALIVAGAGLTFGAFPRPGAGEPVERAPRTVLGRPVGRRRDETGKG